MAALLWKPSSKELQKFIYIYIYFKISRSDIDDLDLGCALRDAFEGGGAQSVPPLKLHVAFKLMAAFDDVIHQRLPQSPLTVAARGGHVQILKLLLADERVDVNHATIAMGTTALFMASCFGRADVVTLLLGMEGVDVNQGRR